MDFFPNLFRAYSLYSCHPFSNTKTLKEDNNLILTDWAEGAKHLHKEAAANAIQTGKSLGNFIVNGKINPKLVHCIGQGLG